MKRFKKQISILLIVALVVTLIPTYAFATDTKVTKEQELTASSDALEKSGEEVTKVAEDESLREEDVKHYINSDGTMTAEKYSYPVHYQKNDSEEWEEIDNTLVTKTEVSSTKKNVEYYVPSSSPLDVKLAKNTGFESLGTISNGEYDISWEYVEYTLGEKKYVNNHTDGIVESKVAIEKENASLASSTKTTNLDKTTETIEASDTTLDAFKDKLKDKVTYESFAYNTDLEYTLFSNSLKENIILNSVNAPSTFIIKYDIGDLVPSSLDDKTIVLRDKENNDIATISAPYMYDSAQDISNKLNLSIKAVEKNLLFVELKADDSWLKDKNRVYPVTIDPYIDFGVKHSETNATAVYQGEESVYPYGSLMVGNNSSYGKVRTYIQFELPNLKAGDMITGASLKLNQMANPLGFSAADNISNIRINVHNVKGEWDYTQIKNSRGFTNLPEHNTAVIDYAKVGENTTDKFKDIYFDISEVVKNWYEGEPNNGICLKASDESAMAVVSFVSSENGNVETDKFPTVEINYLNNKGIESRWTYHEQDLDQSGNAYVNDYTGNLVYIAPLVSTNGKLMPVDLSLVYNGYQKGNQIDQSTKVGKGFRLNIQERVIPIVDGSSNLHSSLYDTGFRFIYEDSDGTAHYFKETEDGKYEDEEGLGLVLTEYSSINGNLEKYEIKSDDSSKITFTSRGYLRRVVDDYDNYIKVLYADDNSGQITGVFDGAGKYIEINRDENGNVTSIIDPAGREIKLTYAPEWGGLRYIEYPDGAKTTLYYADSARLNFIRGRDGNILSYSYLSGEDDSVKNRVSKIAEYSSADDGSLNYANQGNYLDISYKGNNRTSFTDKDGMREVYQFDNSGRTVCITDDEGNAVNYSYESAETTDKKANTLKSTSVTSNYVANLLRNHNAETNLANEYYYTDGISRSSEAKYLGYKSIKVPAGEYIYQNYTPNSGKYTFSSYINTTSEDTKAYLKIYYYDASGNYIDGVTTKALSSVGKWQRFSVTVDLPSTAKKISVRCVTEGSGSSYYDCLQLERGEVANIYNMVENGNMENASSNAWESVNTSGDDGYYVGNTSNGRYYYMTGNGTSNKRLVQKIYINKPAKDVHLNVRAYSKADSVPLNDNTRKYAIGIHTFYTDGTSDETYTNFADFNPNYQDGWQATSGTFDCILEEDEENEEDANKIVDYIYVKCIYFCNANSARFDNIKVSLDETGISYSYDEDGNLESAEDNADRIETYEYTDAGMVSTATTADGQNYEFTYDSDNEYNLESAVSKSSNIKSSFDYDNNGNLKYTRVRSLDSDGNATGKYLHQSYSYTSDGNYLVKEVDDRGHATEYTYNQTKGLVTSVIDRNDNEMHYDYFASSDNLYSISDKVYENNSDATTVFYEYNNRNYLSKIKSPTTTYNFTYDSFGNILETKAGNVLLSQNSYENHNGNLASTIYGNGFIEKYTYDKYGRVTKYSENDTNETKYVYTSEGQLGKLEDGFTNKTHKYNYDLMNRLIREDISDESYIKYNYNNVDLGTYMEYGFKGKGARGVKSTYLEAENLPESTIFGDNTVTNTYDELARLTKTTYKATNTGVDNPEVTYIYVDWNEKYGEPDRTTEAVNTIAYSHSSSGLTLDDITYGYDKEGNITWEVTDSGDEKYTYDSKNQLIRHDSAKANKSYTYSYDKAGNILAKKVYALTYGTLGTEQETISYGYNNSDWKDLLTSYGNIGIEYDSAGNMISFGSKTYSWAGRKLTKIIDGSNTYTYGYNESGIRASKTVDGTTTEYLLNGDQILAQEKDGKTMWFFYDSQGQRVGLNYNGYDYYYMYNLQGDVVGIMRRATGEIVATYQYDAWGKCISVENKDGYTIGDTNPFRYRGYYYDTESGLYYLNSRYYNPEIGRFISPEPNVDYGAFDDGAGLVGYNVYAYCANNPVMLVDYDGESVTIACVLIGAGVGLVIGAYGGSRVAKKKTLKPSDGWKYWKYVVGYGVLGTVAGGLVGYGAGALVAKYGVGTAASSITKGGGARFSSFSALKRSMGSAGKGKHWHHIVEQSQISKSGFSKYWIHNSNNVIKIDASVHAKITAYYNKVHNFTGGKTFRNWLAGKSFKEQYKWGVKVLKMYGVKVR